MAITGMVSVKPETKAARTESLEPNRPGLVSH